MNADESKKLVLVPNLGESVSQATITKWYKNTDQTVQADEVIAEIETEKVSLEICSPANGIIEKIFFPEGTKVNVGDVVAQIIPTSSENNPRNTETITTKNIIPDNPTPKPENKNTTYENSANGQNPNNESTNTKQINLKSRQTFTIPLPPIRQKIAQRLKYAQNTAAILTTFNEVNMQNVISLRNKYKDDFEKKYNVKLGFMSFFLKASIYALKKVPAVNNFIENEQIISRNYYDINVAVSAPTGLVVPLIRDVENLNFAQIEQSISNLGNKARENKLAVDDMESGTFTISNGGIFGSLLSTPIINPPQSAILGMHKIQDRPIAENNQIVIRPMMYLALSYDHRLIDGKEAVTFLVAIKEFLENPGLGMLEV